ncbi:hypothetical protein [Azospirillum cavernae]|uniref:hypothetical protein n=1 Tax=Azospirillum cavernae TaxID=2320860 RepID=UPI0011C3D196|nr:hypothetical protein [Azospirillum cavernae]
MSERVWNYLLPERRTDPFGYADIGSLARAEIIDTVRIADAWSHQRIIDALYDRHYSSNQYRVHRPSVPEGEVLLFLHRDHLNLAADGAIPDVDKDAPGSDPSGQPIRSMAILSAATLRSIRAPEAPDMVILPDLETPQVPFDDPVLNAIRPYFPDLLASEQDTLAEMFSRSARHMLAYNRRAEVIWGWLGDHINSLGIPFNALAPTTIPANGNDGGVDDLRRLASGGLVATQVKGGKTWGNTCYPAQEAKKLFSVDGGQVVARAFDQRAVLYPTLKQPIGTEGIIEDDLLVGHFLAFGKRYPGTDRLIRGKTWPAARGTSGPPAQRQNRQRDPAPLEIDRRFYITGLDVIVLDDPEYRDRGVRVDLSTASNQPKRLLSEAGLLSKTSYDVPAPARSPKW